MALNFPTNPYIGQQYFAPNNSIYTWDGAKWTSTPVPITGNILFNNNTIGTNNLGNVYIQADTDTWEFGNTGNLYFPQGGYIGVAYNDTSAINIVSPPGSYVELTSSCGNAWIASESLGVCIGTNYYGNDYTWSFNNSGNLTLPHCGTIHRSCGADALTWSGIQQKSGPAGPRSVEIGYNAGSCGSVGVVSIGTNAGNVGQQACAIAVGSAAGQTNQGLLAVAVGSCAGQSYQGNYSVAVGINAARGYDATGVFKSYNPTSQILSVGNVTGSCGIFIDSVVRGVGFCNTPTVQEIVTTCSTTWCVTLSAPPSGAPVACEPLKFSSGQGQFSVAIGANSGEYSQGTCSIAIGRCAGTYLQGTCSVAIGRCAGIYLQSGRSVAVGSNAGEVIQGSCAIAIGSNAGLMHQGNMAIAIGTCVGTSNQPDHSIMINATNIALNGSNVGLYINPVRYCVTNVGNVVYYDEVTSELTYAGPVSLDWNTIQNINGPCGPSQIAIGNDANAVFYGVAIGQCAGRTSPGAEVVAIGLLAGACAQGNQAVAVGQYAGQVGQGQYSIAIGSAAGYINQPACSIMLNARGSCSPLNGTNSGFYVAPVRNCTGNVANAVYYNTVTSEITFGPSAASPDHVASNSYNSPNMVLPQGSDTNWAFGGYSDCASQIWMQAKFDGNIVSCGQGNRGFRVYDAGNDITQFSVDDAGNVAITGSIHFSNTTFMELDNPLDFIISGPYQVAIKPNGILQWTFGNDGSLSAPNGMTVAGANVGIKYVDETIQTTAWNGSTPNLVNGGSSVNLSSSGNLTLAAGGTITEGPSPTGLGNTITLTPSGGSDPNQQLLIYPTLTEGNHLHLTSGALDVTSIFLGNDTQYVRTRADGAIVIGTNDGIPDNPSGGNRWAFDTDGSLTFPDTTIQTTAYERVALPPPTAWGVNIPPSGSYESYNFWFDPTTGVPGMIASGNGSNGNPNYFSIWSVEVWQTASGVTSSISSSGATPVGVVNTGGYYSLAPTLQPGDYAIVRIQDLTNGRVYRTTFMGSYNTADVGNEVNYGTITVERLL